MINAINSGDKDALRKLLKLYSQAVFQRAKARLGNDGDAKNVTRLVFAEVTSAAASGQCKEDIDAWLMSLTDACVYKYTAQTQEESRRLEQERNYFTTPAVQGNTPVGDVYSIKREPIYEQSADNSGGSAADGEYTPFTSVLNIPERPEFSNRQDEYAAQSRAAYAASEPPVVEPVPPARFVPPQYIPPYTEEYQAQSDPVLQQTLGSYAAPFAENTAKHETQIPNLFENENQLNSITPIPNESELVLGQHRKHRKKKHSDSQSSIFIAIVVILLMAAIGVLVFELVSMLLG